MRVHILTKNILHIITGLNDGGAEAVLYRLCTHDAGNTHSVISLMDKGKYGPQLEAAGITVKYLDMPRGRVTLKGLIILWRYLRKNRPDVVQTWMYHADLIGGIVSRLAGVRQVFWGIRNSDLDLESSSRTTIFVAHLCAILSRFVPSAIVSCSQQAATIHKELGYAKSKFIIIPNGYSLEDLKPDPSMSNHLRTSWGIDSSDALIGMVARFDPQKDHANLILALENLKNQNVNFRCVLIGTGMTPDNQFLRDLISAHSLTEDVLLLGRRDDIPAVMSALDLHILSSKYGEAFPNVLAEAMVCGTPCVSTDVGDAAMIIGDTGWVVRRADPVSLAEAIVEALVEMRDKQRWSQRSEYARSRIIDNFTISRMVTSYHKAWGIQS